MKIQLDQVAYMGNYLPNLPIQKAVGLPLTLQKEVFEFRNSAMYITTRSSSYNSVREICDRIFD